MQTPICTLYILAKTLYFERSKNIMSLNLKIEQSENKQRMAPEK
jgi:hypothetical protein